MIDPVTLGITSDIWCALVRAGHSPARVWSRKNYWNWIVLTLVMTQFSGFSVAPAPSNSQVTYLLCSLTPWQWGRLAWGSWDDLHRNQDRANTFTMHMFPALRVSSQCAKPLFIPWHFTWDMTHIKVSKVKNTSKLHLQNIFVEKW